MVGVAHGDHAAGGAEGDLGLAEVGNGGRGLHLLIGGDLQLGLVGLALDLGQQHIHGTLGTVLLPEDVHTLALGIVLLVLRRADGLTRQQLSGKAGHQGYGLADTGGGLSHPQDVHVLLEHIHGGVFLVQAGDGLHPRLLLGCLAHVAAGDAEAAGVKGRTGNDEVGLILLDLLQQEGPAGLHVLGIEVIAADDRGHDLGNILQRGTEGIGGTMHPLKDLRLCIRHILAADLTEELVGIEQNFLHSFPLLRQTVVADR